MRQWRAGPPSPPLVEGDNCSGSLSPQLALGPAPRLPPSPVQSRQQQCHHITQHSSLLLKDELQGGMREQASGYQASKWV